MALDSFAQSEVDQNAVKTEIKFQVIVENIDRNLFEGEKDKIKAHIDERKKYINELIVQLEQKLDTLNLQIENTQKLVEKDESGNFIDNPSNTNINKTLGLFIEEQSQIKILII